jgi:DNA-binding winged helix-turn-helix (wHTH) protein
MTPQGEGPVPRVLAVRCDPSTIDVIQVVAKRCGAVAQDIDDVLAAIVAAARWGPGLVLLPAVEATEDVVLALRSAGHFELVLLGHASPGTADMADAVLSLPLSAPQLALHIALSVPLPPQGLPVPRGNDRHLRVGRVELDLLGRTVVVLGRPGVVHLTGREFDLLRDLMVHVGELRTREELLLTVWGINFHATTTVVEVTVSRLRAKTHLDELHTVHAQGYRLTAIEAGPTLMNARTGPVGRATPITATSTMATGRSGARAG